MLRITLPQFHQGVDREIDLKQKQKIKTKNKNKNKNKTKTKTTTKQKQKQKQKKTRTKTKTRPKTIFLYPKLIKILTISPATAPNSEASQNVYPSL